MENLTQGLKVICEKPSAKCMKAIRDKTNLPFSEIKDMIQDNKLFLETEMSNMNALIAIIELYYQLSAIGVNCELYELGYKSTIDVFRNRLNRNKEISEETWKEMFEEGEDDDE